MGIMEVMPSSKTILRTLSPVFLIFMTWVTFSEAYWGIDYIQGEPTKDFEIIHKGDFCEENMKGAGQCARVNDNNLKFFFSVFFTIAWGGAVRTVIRTFELSIPYTVVLLITGLIIGLGNRITLDVCTTWVQYTKFARTPPELILFIFLPPLIFESAFSMKAHVFFSNFMSIITLALPGMLLTTILTAVAALQFMDNYDWSLAQAGLFGAIVSATDPVAVVAILRELGTSETLNIMIEGESLLNDGVAILIYEILKDIVEEPDKNVNYVTILIQFLRIAVGGPLFGFVMGKIVIFCVTQIYNDAPTEITITLVAAYFTYFVGEFYLGVSGVMAVVLLGVTISATDTCISPDTMHTCKLFWEMMGFLANTILFVILGIVISETAINSFEVRDGLNLIWLYFALNLIRLVMLMVLTPVLRRVGYDFNWREMAVIMWSGLRGAIGICLALEVYRNKKICTFKTVGPKFLLNTAGIVILSLLINGTTTKSLLKFLGITNLSVGKLQDMAHTIKNLTAARVRAIITLKHDAFLADSNWDIVHIFTHVKDPYASKQKRNNEARKTDSEKDNAENNRENMRDASARLNEKLIKEGYLYNFKPTTSLERPNMSESPSAPSVTNLHKRESFIRKSSGDKPFAGSSSESSSEEDEDIESLMRPDLKESEEFKKMMDECRIRVLKSMKISCWGQYERGALSEEAVKAVVGSIEAKEDNHFYMIHVSDLQHHWETRGILGWCKRNVEETHSLMQKDPDPPKPKSRWRHPFHWIATKFLFDVFIYFVIFCSMVPTVLEIVIMVREWDHNPPRMKYWEKPFLFICVCTFTGIFFLEFLIKIIGRGVRDYCSSRLNVLDFIVLLYAIAEFVTELLMKSGKIEQLSSAGMLTALRIIRLLRLFRLAKALIPVLTRIITYRVNAHLFIGYDIACGFATAIEDALRLLPGIAPYRRVYRKFRNLLDEDRLKIVREVLSLQMEYPGVAVAVKTRHASRSICRCMRDELSTMKEEGILEENEFELLISKIDGNLKRLWEAPTSINTPSIDAMITRMPWAIENDHMIEYFKEYRQILDLSAGDVIYDIGEPPNGIHFIVKGITKLQYEPSRDVIRKMKVEGIIPNSEHYLDLEFSTTQWNYLGFGSVIGEYGVLTNLPRHGSIICETDVQVLFWSNEHIKLGMDIFNDPTDSLEARLWRSWGIKFATEYLHTVAAFSGWNNDRIRTHLEQGVVPIGENFDQMTIPEYITDTILIYGEIMNEVTGETLQAPALVPSTWTTLSKLPVAKVEPKILLITDEDIVEGLQEKASQTSLEKIIVHGPGNAMMFKDFLEFGGGGSTSRFTIGGKRTTNALGKLEKGKSRRSSWVRM